MNEDAKFRAETNRDFLIFWAILFFTCVVGIIELLPEIKRWSFPIGSRFLFFEFPTLLLYSGLLVGIVISVFRCFAIYETNARLARSGELGEYTRECAIKNPTPIDRFFFTGIRSDKPKLRKWLELVFIFSIVIVFVLLYFARSVF